MSRALAGPWFEDLTLGRAFQHAAPRTLHGGDLSLYAALTGDVRALHGSTLVAQALGYPREVIPDLLAFHIAFGCTVRDISQAAIANLGYADARFFAPVHPGDTIRAETEVIGRRQISRGDAGVVYVTTRAFNQRGRPVLSFTRWVLVPKRDAASPAGDERVPALPESVAADALPIPPARLDRFADVAWATGGARYWDDYRAGERIEHPGGATIAEAEHAMATRLYQNAAQVHADGHRMAASRWGRRLVYGGHVLSVAHALAASGLANALWMAAWNGGTHLAPVFAGDTIYAATEVAEVVPAPGRDDLGALRLRLCASKRQAPRPGGDDDGDDGDDDGARAEDADDAQPVLELDYWALMPRRPA